MSNNTVLNETYKAWADIVLERWMKKMILLKIGRTDQLYNSLVYELFTEAGGNVAKIAFAFHYYGKFVDMGVGNGVSVGEVSLLSSERRFRGSERGNRRRPKKWYSTVFYTEAGKLRFLLAEKYAIKGALMIIENIDDRSTHSTNF